MKIPPQGPALVFDADQVTCNFADIRPSRLLFGM